MNKTSNRKTDREAARLRPGSTAAKQAVEDLRQPLAAIVRRICPAWLTAQADDLVQNALLRVHDVARREGNPRFGASYLWRVAHSVMIDEIRNRRRRGEVSLTDEVKKLRVSSEPDPELRAAGRQTGLAIRECLRRLVEARRRAVTLYLLGHSVPESARLLRWSPKKTENLVYRGLADLRQCLRAKGIEP